MNVAMDWSPKWAKRLRLGLLYGILDHSGPQSCTPRSMSKTFAAAGIRFQYPDEWVITEERGPEELTITVTDGQTAQWSITLMREAPSPKRVLSQAVQAFREEYDDLDVEERNLNIANHDAIAADLDFECFELLNCAFLRAFQTERDTVLVMYQATDHEMSAIEPIFEAINKSLRCDLDLFQA
jgi:hypothetical protein